LLVISAIGRDSRCFERYSKSRGFCGHAGSIPSFGTNKINDLAKSSFPRKSPQNGLLYLSCTYSEKVLSQYPSENPQEKGRNAKADRQPEIAATISRNWSKSGEWR